jgi:hypothetical protein
MLNAIYDRRLRALLTVLTSAVCVAACHTASTLQKVEPAAGPVTVSALWMAPDDLATRDLLNGVGGEKSAPHTDTFAWTKDESLGSWGYDVKDADGRKWSVKLGEEVQSEVAVSRLLWAIGYYQPPVYVVDRWTLTGKHAGPQPQGRFRLEHDDGKVVDIWSWHQNPFVGTREFAGLIVANVLFNNWDFKPQNNKVYEYKQPLRGQTRAYVVRDLGASLGMTRSPANLTWFLGNGHPLGTKNNVADFEKQGFVRRAEGDHIEFDVVGREAQALLHSVTIDDVHWVCDLLNHLSQDQMLDAFKAAHYDKATADRYVKKIREKVTQGLALTATSSTDRREQ